LVWEPSRALTLAWLALTFVQGLLPALSIALSKPVVDALVAVLRSGGAWGTSDRCCFRAA
jgi:ATP-binding cassette subfamily B protein